MLKIVGHRVLVKPKPPEEVSKGGIVISYGDKEQMVKSGAEEGTVLQVGKTAWKSSELGFGTEDWEPWAKPGDKVLYARYSGKWTKDPDTQEDLLILNDVDIQARIE